jgi:Uma2 family endonuclease
MNAALTPPRLTPDDLLRMPDGGRGYELVDGRPVELNVSTKSSRVGATVVRLLGNYAETVRPGWVVQSDASFRCFPDDSDRVRRADAAYIALDRLTPAQYEAEGHCTVCPDLVVEVVSPNDLASELNRKTEEWLAAGAKLVWVIDPDPKIVFCHTPTGVVIRREADTLTGDPVLPGFNVPVADLFRLPTATPA